MTKSWGLALSGGSAFGIANAGVIEVLERENLHPNCIVGSSMGAIVGALWALGCTTQDMRAVCSGLSLLSVASLSDTPFKGGLHGGLLRQRLREHLAPYVGQKSISDCRIPFTCIAGRVKSPIQWERILFDGFSSYLQSCVEKYVFPPETMLIDALLATSALPILFSPVRIGNDEFVDLVAFGALPSRTLRDTFHPDIIIGTDTNPRYENIKPFLPPGWQEFLHDTETSLDESRRSCDLLIAPKLTGNCYRFDHAMTFYEAGGKQRRK